MCFIQSGSLSLSYLQASEAGTPIPWSTEGCVQFVLLTNYRIV